LTETNCIKDPPLLADFLLYTQRLPSFPQPSSIAAGLTIGSFITHLAFMAAPPQIL